ncbi:MAG: hypothetical protein WC755_03080 [Candidatus Woesearchaeota archaeon]|jgi:hypothetical protein
MKSTIVKGLLGLALLYSTQLYSEQTTAKNIQNNNSKNNNNSLEQNIENNSYFDSTSNEIDSMGGYDGFYSDSCGECPTPEELKEILKHEKYDREHPEEAAKRIEDEKIAREKEIKEMMKTIKKNIKLKTTENNKKIEAKIHLPRTSIGYELRHIPKSDNSYNHGFSISTLGDRSQMRIIPIVNKKTKEVLDVIISTHSYEGKLDATFGERNFFNASIKGRYDQIYKISSSLGLFTSILSLGMNSDYEFMWTPNIGMNININIIKDALNLYLECTSNGYLGSGKNKEINIGSSIGLSF